MDILNIRQPYLLAPLVITLVSGCAILGAKPSRVDITSDPAGADVYVMGSRVGLTPLTVDENTIFPLTYPGEIQALYGAVELRKAGCNSAMQRVSTRAVVKGVHVKLDCGEVAHTETSTPRHAQPSQPPVSANGQAQTTPVVEEKFGIALRLKQVEDLRDTGLITEQEAREIRQRILGEL